MNPPYDGQTFGNLQELIQNSCSYAKAVGFQWRKRTSRKDENNGEICGIRMVCNKEGKPGSLGPSMKEGCPVALNSTLQKGGHWRINKISLQHSHEIVLNVRPFLRRRCRSIPPQVRYPLELNDRLSIEGEKEREAEEEEGAVSVASEQSQDPSDDENASPSINDAIMEEQPSFEGSFNQQDAIEERGTTCRQSHNLAVNVEQHWKKLKREMDTVMQCNSDNINQLSNTKRTVYKQNLDLSAKIHREKLALQVEESKLSQLTSEEARIEAEIQNLMEKKQSVLLQKASGANNTEKGNQKMEELKNTQEKKINKAENSFLKWQKELSNANTTFISNLMDSKRVLFKKNV